MVKPSIHQVAQISETFPLISHAFGKDNKLFFNIKKDDSKSFSKLGFEMDGTGFIREQDPYSFSPTSDPTFLLKATEENVNSMQLLDDRAFDYAFTHRADFWPSLQDKKSHQKLSVDELRDEYRDEHWTGLITVKDNGSFSSDGVWTSDPSNPVKIIRFKPKIAKNSTPRYLRETEDGKIVDIDPSDIQKRQVRKVQWGIYGYTIAAQKKCGLSKYVIAFLLGDKYEKKDKEAVPEGDIDNFSGFGVQFSESTPKEVVTEVPAVVESEPMVIDQEEKQKTKKQKTKK